MEDEGAKDIIMHDALTRNEIVRFSARAFISLPLNRVNLNNTILNYDNFNDLSKIFFTIC